MRTRSDCIVSKRVFVLLLAAAICVISSGCESMRKVAYESKVGLYLKTNPNVAEDIRDGLRTKSLVKGMTKEEVTICLGDPLKKEWTKHNADKEVWIYSRLDKRRPA